MGQSPPGKRTHSQWEPAQKPKGRQSDYLLFCLPGFIYLSGKMKLIKTLDILLGHHVN